MRRDRQLTLRFLALLVALGALTTQAGCATLRHPVRHPEFTSDRVLGLRVGLTTDEVIALFGQPDRTEATTCGSQSGSPWQCLIWEWDLGPNKKGRHEYSSNINRLYFSMDLSPPRLNNWSVDLMYDSPKP